MDRAILVAIKHIQHSHQTLRLCLPQQKQGTGMSAWKESKRLKHELRHLTRLKTRLAYNSISFVTKAPYGGNLVLKLFRQRFYLCTYDDLYGHETMKVYSANSAHTSTIMFMRLLLLWGCLFPKHTIIVFSFKLISLSRFVGSFLV